MKNNTFTCYFQVYTFCDEISILLHPIFQDISTIMALSRTGNFNFEFKNFPGTVQILSHYLNNVLYDEPGRDAFM